MFANKNCSKVSNSVAKTPISNFKFCTQMYYVEELVLTEAFYIIVEGVVE